MNGAPTGCVAHPPQVYSAARSRHGYRISPRVGLLGALAPRCPQQVISPALGVSNPLPTNIDHWQPDTGTGTRLTSRHQRHTSRPPFGPVEIREQGRIELAVRVMHYQVEVARRQ